MGKSLTFDWIISSFCCFKNRQINHNNTKNMNKILPIMTVACLLLNSCASMFSGTKETIHVRSNLPNTVFYANERELGRGTSASFTLPKKKLSTTTLRAEKKGYNTKTMPIETSFDAVCLLGILIDWGVFSIVCVDWLGTGAVTKAAQTDYVLTPE
jgi:hypothetical protein